MTRLITRRDPPTRQTIKERLEPLGERSSRWNGFMATTGLWWHPTTFRDRDVVAVYATSDAEAQGTAGLVGVIDSFSPRNDLQAGWTLGVWFDDLGESRGVEDKDLVWTGKRAPRGW